MYLYYFFFFLQNSFSICIYNLSVGTKSIATYENTNPNE